MTFFDAPGRQSSSRLCRWMPRAMKKTRWTFHLPWSSPSARLMPSIISRSPSGGLRPSRRRDPSSDGEDPSRAWSRPCFTTPDLRLRPSTRRSIPRGLHRPRIRKRGCEGRMPTGNGRSTVDSIPWVRTRLLRLAFIAALVTLLTGTQASADVAFEDAVGDQRNMDDLVAPDITSVGVSNTPNGVITFQVTIANHTALPPRSRIAVLFDIDRRQSTGFVGFEYAFSHEIDDAGQAHLKFERWDEPNLEFDV